jgi:hypothetical protein
VVDEVQLVCYTALIGLSLSVMCIYRILTRSMFITCQYCSYFMVFAIINLSFRATHALLIQDAGMKMLYIEYSGINLVQFPCLNLFYHAEDNISGTSRVNCSLPAVYDSN